MPDFVKSLSTPASGDRRVQRNVPLTEQIDLCSMRPFRQGLFLQPPP
jgi:hypothetical protein